MMNAAFLRGEQLRDLVHCDVSDVSDSELLQLLQTGEQAAAEQIFFRYADRLLRLTKQKSNDRLRSRLDPQDIVQSVFRSFFRRAAVGHYELPQGDELWKLFLVISLNKIRKKADHHCAARRDVRITETIGETSIASVDSPATMLQTTISELIAQFPDEHQQVLQDRIQGYEVSEIASRNGISRRTTERILQNFRAHLRKELEVLE